MMNLNRNPQNLKAVHFPENFFEMPDNVLKTNCLSVIDYKYRCYRERDDFNNPYGSFLTENLIFTVKASSLNDCSTFYKLMDELGFVDREDYQGVLKTIKENQNDWLDYIRENRW